MKKIGDYSVRGSGADNEVTRIKLFDGRFDTAYKLIEFRIFAGDMASTDCTGRVTTEPNLLIGDNNFWNANDQRQIAWAGSNGASDIGSYQDFNLVDPDNLIVEDIYISVRTPHSTTNRINYFMQFEKYDISDSLGALAMVRNKSQGGSA